MLYRAGGDQDNLFLMLLRATNLITETIPKHKDFRPDAPGYLKFHRLLGAMVTELEQLKLTLDARDVAMARARKAAADAARPSLPAAGGAGPGVSPQGPPSLQHLALDDIRVRSGEAAPGPPPAMEMGSSLPGSPAVGPGPPLAAFPGSPHGAVALTEQGSPAGTRSPTPMPYPVVGMRPPGPPPAPLEAPSAPNMPVSSPLAPVFAAPPPPGAQSFAPAAKPPPAVSSGPAPVLPGALPTDIGSHSAPVGTASVRSGPAVQTEAAAQPRPGPVVISPQEPVVQAPPEPSPMSGPKEVPNAAAEQEEGDAGPKGKKVKKKAPAKKKAQKKSGGPILPETAEDAPRQASEGAAAAPGAESQQEEAGNQKPKAPAKKKAQKKGGGPILPETAGDAPRQASGGAAAAPGAESQEEEAGNQMPKKRKSSGRGKGATCGVAQPRGSGDVRESVPQQETGAPPPEALPQKQAPPEKHQPVPQPPSPGEAAVALAAQREAAAAAAAAQEQAAVAAAAAQREAAAAAAAAQQQALQQAAAAAAAAQQQQQAQVAAAAAAAAQVQAQQQAAAATAAQGWVGPGGQREQYLSPVQHYPSNLPTAVDWRRHPQIVTSGGYPVAPPAMVAATNVAPPQPQPHQPRTGATVPSAHDSRADHMTLDQRLKAYGLQEKTIKGDGNCQFRSLADQLFGTPDRHVEVRRMVIAQLTRNADDYSVFVPDDYSDYVRKMSKDGEWGDHLTLQAASDVYGRRICVLSTYEKNFLIEITPKSMRHPRVLWLSFWAEVHYNSIYPASS